MTDKEWQKLCEDLRYWWKYPPYMEEACIKAADEIERLAKELAKAQRLCGDMLQSQHRLEKRLLMTDSQRTKVTAAKALEAIGLNDPTIAALLKELKENAMTKSAMTDEERKKLCEWLRRGSHGWSGSQVIEPKMAQAADEIERLQGESDWLRTALRAAQTAEPQSDAEPPMFQCPECGEEIPHKSECKQPAPQLRARAADRSGK